MSILISKNSSNQNFIDNDQTIYESLKNAIKNRSYKLLTAGFFVCGFHVTFVSTHLPAFLSDNNLDARLAGFALALIGLFNIFGTLYELWYYNKSARESLRSFTYSDSVDWVTLKEGDTTIQRQNKNSVAKTYRDLAVETNERLKELLYQYTYQKSSPIQVAGADGTFNLSGKLV